MNTTYVPESGGPFVEGKHFEQHDAKCYVSDNKGGLNAECSRNLMCDDKNGLKCLRYMIEI